MPSPSSSTSQCTNVRDRHLAFLLHGDRGQDVHLFLERIERYWQEEFRTFAHRAFRVNLHLDGTVPHTASEWDQRLRRAIAYPGFPLGGALGTLEQFLAHKMPQCLSRNQLSHPLRLLFAIEHDMDQARAISFFARRRKDPLVEKLRHILRKSQKAARHWNVHFGVSELGSLHFPLWEEIETDFRNYLGEELFEILETQCADAYDSVVEHHDAAMRSFSCLADALDGVIKKHLESHPQTQPKTPLAPDSPAS